MASCEEVTRLLAEISGGNRQAESELIPLVYNELRRIAANLMRQERPNHTLQPTAVVHEAYLRLIRQQAVSWQSKAHFLAVAATLMRRILLDYARARGRQKRGDKVPRLPLEQEHLVFSENKSEELIALDRALSRLAEVDPRQSQVVELRYFGGLTVEETAAALGISPKTVKREWSVARAWLRREIRIGKRNDARATGKG
jgi:RNA polymerase sigma factor (TIGR02999 family)